MWSIEAQEELWNKAGGMTPAASARVLKGGESESTPPIISWLCNIYLQKRHGLGSYYSISTL